MREDFPFPDLDEPLSGAYWRAAQHSELRLPRCSVCSAWHWYPVERCCDRAPEWRLLEGKATLFSWSEVRRPLFQAYPKPYIVALVAPQEASGVRLITQLLGCRVADLRVDMPLEVVFRPLELVSAAPPAKPLLAPFFRPADRALRAKASL